MRRKLESLDLGLTAKHSAVGRRHPRGILTAAPNACLRFLLLIEWEAVSLDDHDSED